MYLHVFYFMNHLTLGFFKDNSRTVVPALCREGLNKHKINGHNLHPESENFSRITTRIVLNGNRTFDTLALRNVKRKGGFIIR